MRDYAARLTSSEALSLQLLKELAEHRGLTVSCAVYESTEVATGELGIELWPAETTEGAGTQRALLLVREDGRAAMSTARLFFLDHVFEVQR